MSEFALSYVEWLRAFFLHSKKTKNSRSPEQCRKGMMGAKRTKSSSTDKALCRDSAELKKQQKPETVPEGDEESEANKIPFHRQGTVQGFLRNFK